MGIILRMRQQVIIAGMAVLIVNHFSVAVYDGYREGFRNNPFPHKRNPVSPTLLAHRSQKINEYRRSANVVMKTIGKTELQEKKDDSLVEHRPLIANHKRYDGKRAKTNKDGVAMTEGRSDEEDFAVPPKIALPRMYDSSRYAEKGGLYEAPPPLIISHLKSKQPMRMSQLQYDSHRAVVSHPKKFVITNVTKYIIDFLCPHCGGEISVSKNKGKPFTGFFSKSDNDKDDITVSKGDRTFREDANKKLLNVVTQLSYLNKSSAPPRVQRMLQEDISSTEMWSERSHDAF